MAQRTPPPASPMDVFWAAPPFSRTITALTLTISVLVYTGLLSGYWIMFYMPFLLKIPPQIWRLFTCFMLSGPQLGIIFDPYFLYTYGSKLETSSPRFSEAADFYAYIIFLWGTILSLIAVDGSWKRGRSPLHFDRSVIRNQSKGLFAVQAWWECPLRKLVRFINFYRVVVTPYILIGLNFAFTGATVLTSALILALTYTACQDDRLSKVNFFVVTIPATWVPLAMLFLTFVINGGAAAQIQATGLVAAHAHDFLSNLYPTFGGGANMVQTPAFIKRFFAVTVQRVTQRAYGTAITNPRQAGGSAASTGSSSSTAGSVLPESWKSRGTGHRLGGD